MRMNPVYKNELKMSARSIQLPVLAVIFNSILSVVALIALYGIRQNYINSGGNPYHSMMILYVVVLTIEVVLLCLLYHQQPVAASPVSGNVRHWTFCWHQG